MLRRFRFLLLALCTGTVLTVGVVDASAAVRFAAPGGDGRHPCPEASPCSLFHAASTDVPNAEEAQDGDEVVVLSGDYSGAEGDLGPDERLSIPTGVDIRGEPRHPKPAISSDRRSSILILNGHSTASDLEIIATESRAALLAGQSIAQRLVVRTSAEGGIACSLAFRGILRDSVCISSGRKGAGAGQRVGTNPYPGNTRTLRNVTAIGAGPESAGLRFDISGGEVFANVKSTIAQGTAVDVEAVGSEPEGVTMVALDASAFATTKVVQRDGGIAVVTQPGTDGNITASPLLAAGHFHQLPGSPTIDRGIVDEWSGSSDIDGDARVVGDKPDIGADEMTTPTTTVAACLPASLQYGQRATCEATIAAVVPSSPTGTVEFAAESADVHTDLGTCELSSASANQANCELSFPAMSVDPGLRLIATYSGDPSHGASQGVTQLSVSANPTVATVACVPTVVIVGQPVVCRTTVASAITGSVAPIGTIHLESNGAGSFWLPSSCVLAQTGPDHAGCQATYVPSALGSGVHGIAASYAGDEGHLASRSATLSLAVLPSRVSPSRPNTTLKRRPARRTARHRATFAFGSTEPGSRFRCKLDRKPYRSCRSPFKARVARGRHVFRVQAVGSSGPDPRPATFRWRVVRRLPRQALPRVAKAQVVPDFRPPLVATAPIGDRVAD